MTTQRKEIEFFAAMGGCVAAGCCLTLAVVGGHDTGALVAALTGVTLIAIALATGQRP